MKYARSDLLSALLEFFYLLSLQQCNSRYISKECDCAGANSTEHCIESTNFVYLGVCWSGLNTSFFALKKFQDLKAVLSTIQCNNAI